MTGQSISARLCSLLAVVGAAYAQFIGSGSNGTDGALALTAPGEVLFDPRAFTPALNPAGDNIYHFTSIYIASGVTVKLSANVLRSPVFWLAQGPVQIDGTIDLNGADGGPGPSLAGAGGYPGGAAGKPGYGPAGFTANVFLVPLTGGFGGDGGETQGGGSGGGALLIASSTSISINGSIMSNGGNALDGIGGGGGAIRLVAPVIEGAGTLSARGGQPQGTNGRIRFEALDNRFAGNLSGTPFAQGKPFGLFLPPNPPPSVRIISVGGVALTKAEFNINQPSRVRVAIEARNIPPGTPIELQFFHESGAEQILTTTPLEGTFALSRAMAAVTLPSGRTHCYVKANWRQPAREQ